LATASFINAPNAPNVEAAWIGIFFFLMDTVRSQFKTLIINLRHQPDITVLRIIARLSLDEEERRNTSSSGVALYLQGNNSGRGRGRGGRNRGGRGRGGRGRGQSQGRNWNRSDGQQEQKTNAQSNSQSSVSPYATNTSTESNKRKLSDAVCYQCGELGHFRRDCPLKKRVDEAIKRQRTKSKSTESQALVVTNQPANQIDDGSGDLID
jgi:hypothetical protein